MGDFRGFFLSSNNRGIFPEKYINWASYKSTPNSVSELDSYVNTNNKLIRKVAKNTRSKIEFNTIPINDVELAEIWEWLKGNMSNTLEKKLNIIAWNEQDHEYQNYEVYVPDISYVAKRHDANHIYYESVRFAFISYANGTTAFSSNAVS
jgi:hypothetical protein